MDKGERDKGVTVGWKSDDFSLIFSGHFHCRILPFMSACSGDYFPCYFYCLYFPSGFPLNVYVCHLRQSCVARHIYLFWPPQQYRAVDTRPRYATVRSSAVSTALTLLSVPFWKSNLYYLSAALRLCTCLWYESTNAGLLILALNPRCEKFITSAASGLIMHVTLCKGERGCLYWKLVGKVNYFSCSVKLSWSTNFWGGEGL
jgi:hypothetical protein